MFGILQWTLHTTHFLKLLDKMCKYVMDLASIVEDTEQIWFHPQTDRRTDKVKAVFTPLSTSLKRGVGGGYNKVKPVHPLSTSWMGGR